MFPATRTCGAARAGAATRDSASARGARVARTSGTGRAAAPDTLVGSADTVRIDACVGVDLRSGRAACATADRSRLPRCSGVTAGSRTPGRGNRSVM